MPFTLSLGITSFRIRNNVSPEKYRGYIGTIKKIFDNSIRFDYVESDGKVTEMGVDKSCVDILYPERKGSDPIWNPFG